MGTIKKVLKQHLIWALIASLVGDGLLFSLTSPNDTPNYVLIIGFVFLAVTFFSLFRLAAVLFGVYLPDFASHAKRLATLLTVLAVLVVVLQSIGQLSPKDALVLTPLVVVVYVYVVISRRRPKRKAS